MGLNFMRNRQFQFFIILCKIFWTTVHMIVATILFTFLGLIALCTWIIPLPQRFLWIGPLWQFFSLWLFRVVLLTKIKKIDRRSEVFHSPTQVALYIANHQSIWDIPLILSTFQVAPIMKKEILKIPIFGLAAYVSGAIPVDRKNKDSRRLVIEKIKNRLQQGIPVQIYPEGTRNKLSHYPKIIAELKTSSMEIAYDLAIPVIPVALWGTGHLQNACKLINWKQPVGILLQQELRPQNFATKEQFINQCWEQVIKGHQELEQMLQSKPNVNF